MSRWLTGILLGALALQVAACEPKAKAASGSQEQAVSVTTLKAKLREVPTTRVFSGELRGERESKIAANAAGRLLEVIATRGTEVEKGGALAKLDVRSAALSAREALANVASADAQRDNAKRECERADSLLKSEAISEQEHERLILQCRMAEQAASAASARAALAAKTVRDGVIRAPFSGWVSERYVEVGEYVRADSPVVHMVQLDPLRLEFTVPESALSLVAPKMKVELSVPAYPDRSFSGVVTTTGASVRAATRDVLIEAEVKNPERLLRPGMFARVRLEIGTEKLPAVSKQAIVRRSGKEHLFVVVNQRLEERVVQLGPSGPDFVAVRRGLSAGEQVVAKPTDALKNGQRVK